MSRCPDCGERAPDTSSFCSVCGACLRPPTTLPTTLIRGGARPTIRLVAVARTATAPPPPAQRRPPSAPRLHPAIPLLGLLFGVLCVLGFAQLMASGGLSVAMLGQIAVLLGGALAAERAWINGEFWGGLRGMLLWGGLIWLLAANGLIPWLLPLLLGWCALHPRWFGWQR